MSYTQQYEDYSNSYNNIMKVLSDIIESGEITPGSQALLEEAYVDYNNSYADTLKTLQSIKDSTIIKRIEDIEIKKIDADKKSIIDILTNNGVNNSIYLDDDNNIIINGEAVPELNQVKLIIDEQNKKIESIVSGGEIEIDGEKKSVQVAFTDLKQTVDGISTTVTDFKQTVEGNYYTKEQTTAQITQKANEITSTVASTYATQESVNNMGSMIQQKTDEITSTVASLQKDLDDNYSTTTEVTSQITQKADEITGSMSKTYATKDSVKNLDTTLQAKIGEVSSTVSSVKKDLADNYTNNTNLASQLLQTENNIKATVSETYATKDSVQTNASQIEQNAKKISMVVASNSTESNVILTDNALTAISNNINLAADHINLEGYTTINGGFKVDKNGNMEAVNGKFTGEINADKGKISSNLEVDGLNVSGDLSTDTLTVRKINCPNLLTTVENNINITVDPSATNITDTFENGGVYSSLQKCLSDIPKNLNGYTITITVNSELSEKIQVSGFNGGELRIMFNKNMKGFVYTADNTAKVLIRGKGTTTQTLKYNYKTTGNLNMREASDPSATIVQTLPTGAQLLVTQIDSNNWGYTTYNGLSGWISLNTAYTVKEEVYETTGTSTAIIPDTLVKDGYHQSSVYVDNCSYVSINGIEIYSKTDDECYAVKGYRNSFVYLKNVKVNGSSNGVVAQLGSRIYTEGMSGKVTGKADSAIMGSTIYIADGTNINGVLEHDSTSQIIYNESNVTKDTTSDVGENTNTTTAASVITINSTSGDTYRSTVYNNWKKDNTVRQGDYGYGDCNGCWFFGTQFSQFKNKNISKVTITINRQAGGVSSAVALAIKTHNYNSRPSGAPTYGSSVGTLSLKTGESGTLTITDPSNALITGLKNGTIKGIGLQSSYTSAQYAVCSGSCSISVTYTG